MKTKIKYVSVVATILALMLTFTACATGNENKSTENQQEKPLAETSPYIYYERHLMTVAVDGKISVYADDKVCDETIDSESITHEQRSLDGSVLAFTTDKNELYVTDGESLVKVSVNVSPSQFQLSVSGGGVAYLTEDGILHCYDTVGKRNMLVAEGEASYSMKLSPDGKTLAYMAGGALMLFDGQQSRELAEGEMTLLGLSDDGKQIYVTSVNEDNETILYSYNAKGNKQKLGEMTSYNGYMFNDNHTQIMFQGKKDKTYLSIKGKEATVMAKDAISLIYTPNTNEDFADGSTYPVSKLYDHVYKCGDEVWLIKQNSDKNVKLVSKASNVQLDESAKYVYYTYDNEELRVAKIGDGEMASEKAKVLVDERVGAYVVTSNRKYVYFVEDGTLYSVDGENGGEPTEIIDDVNPRYLAISSEDVVCFISEGDAYVYMDGKTPSRVRRDTAALGSSPNGFVYAIAEDGSYFFARSGEACSRPTRL